MADDPLEWLGTEAVPTWLQGTWGERLIGAIRLQYGATMEALLAAVMAPAVHLEPSPDDAALAVGRERRLPRYPAESENAYRARLVGAWALGEVEGGPDVIVEQLALALNINESKIHIYTPQTWAAEWPSDTANWSRFWIVIETPGPLQWQTWGPDALGTPFWGVGTWGVTPVEYSSLVRAIVDRFRPAHWICPQVIVQRAIGSSPVWGHGEWNETGPLGLPRIWAEEHPARL